MPERADERQFLPGEEVHEGAAARAHVVDRVLDAQLLDGGDRVPAADDGEAVRLGDGGQEFPRPDGKRLELEDPRGTGVEDRLRAVRILSTIPFSSMCLATAIESSALTPPRWATLGRAGSWTARASIVSSRSMTRPAIEGRTSQNPTRLGWARWAAANASSTKYSASGARRCTMCVVAIFSSFASASASSSE